MSYLHDRNGNKTALFARFGSSVLPGISLRHNVHQQLYSCTMGRHKCGKKTCGTTTASRYASVLLSEAEKKAPGAKELDVELCASCYVGLCVERRASTAVSSGQLCGQRANGFLFSIVFAVVWQSLVL